MGSGTTKHASRAPAALAGDFYKRLFSDAGLAIFACDVKGGIVAWNELGRRMFARCGFEPLDADVRCVLPESDHAVFDKHLAVLQESRQSTEFRTRIRGADRESDEFAVWLEPLFDDSGRITGVSVWFHDITARLAYRRSLRKRERLTTLGALAGSIAHHYNNLLCGIATSMEYARNMNTMSAMRRALRRTTDTVTRAAELTQQLLAFAQADHRSVDRCDLTEAVLYYFDQHERRLADRGVGIDLEWKDLPIISVRKRHIEIVLDNLVNNAVEAMPNGGMLTVRLGRRDEDHAVLAVADDGTGIAPEHMERLFEPFFTTKGVLSEGATRQAGMGLAVAHGLVSEMRGLITAVNRPQGGTQFEVILPIPHDVQSRAAHSD